MKRFILSLLVAVLLIGSASSQVTFSNTQRTQQFPTGETTTVTNNLSFNNSPYNYGDYMSGYNTEINYNSLASGTMLYVYSSDAFHIYPWSRDSWSINRDTSGNGYSTLTLSGDVSGGSISLSDLTPITAVSVESVPDPSTYALFGLGALALIVRYRRHNKSVTGGK